MVFRYDPEKSPVVPSEGAHKANALATDATVAEQSRQTLERQIRKELEHPIHLTLQEASQGSRLILYVLLGSIAFPAVVLWEAVISREIYEVVLPYPSMWWVPIVALMGFGLWSSAALGEAVSDFALLNHNLDAAEREGAIARARGDLYGVSRKKTALGLGFHPATGAFIAIGLLCVIGWFSWRRVELLKELGHDPGFFQVYLPVILYVGEILLGMPAFFVMAYCYKTVRLKKFRTAFVQAKSSEDTLRQAAIQSYTEYLQQLANVNAWADQKQQPQALMVPANMELRQLMTQEWGYDPTQQGTTQPGTPGSHSSSIPVNGNGRTGHVKDDASLATEAAKETEAPHAGMQARPVAPDASRVDDLLGLIDEQITSRNHRF